MRDSDLELQRWNSLCESDRLSLAEDLAFLGSANHCNSHLAGLLTWCSARQVF